MISQDLQDRLNALGAYIGQFDRTKTAREFWAGFEAIEGDLGEQAFASDSDPELLEQFTAILANADEAGFAVPLEMLGEPMNGQP